MQTFRQKVRNGKTKVRMLNAALAAVATFGDGLNAVEAAPVNAVAAALTTALTGANNDLVYTAKTKGAAGNDIKVTYVDPGEETAAESVEVTGKNIVVTLRNVSSVLSTAAQVKAAIEADEVANELVGVANSGADTGAGAVTAMAEDALEGGVDGTIAPANTFIYHGGYAYFTPTASTVSTATWVKSAQFTTF